MPGHFGPSAAPAVGSATVRETNPGAVGDDDFAAVQPCGRNAVTLLPNRHDDLPDRYVGAVGCGANRDHTDWGHTDLFHVWLAFPFTAEFLAPHDRTRGVAGGDLTRKHEIGCPSLVRNGTSRWQFGPRHQ